MSLVVATSSETEIERNDEPWKYPYVAAVVDFGSNFGVRVNKDSSARIGYFINVQIVINSVNKTVIGFLDEFCLNHDIHGRPRQSTDNYRLEIARRDDVYRFLSLVRPYIIARETPVSIMVDELIPRLDDGQGGTQEGFVDLMEYVDEIREHTASAAQQKYTADSFRDEFDL